MKLLCRIGWHDWKHWQEMTNRPAERDYTLFTTRIIYTVKFQRTCACCGKPSYKSVTY